MYTRNLASLQQKDLLELILLAIQNKNYNGAEAVVQDAINQIIEKDQPALAVPLR